MPGPLSMNEIAIVPSLSWHRSRRCRRVSELDRVLDDVEEHEANLGLLALDHEGFGGNRLIDLEAIFAMSLAFASMA